MYTKLKLISKLDEGYKRIRDLRSLRVFLTYFLESCLFMRNSSSGGCLHNFNAVFNAFIATLLVSIMLHYDCREGSTHVVSIKLCSATSSSNHVIGNKTFPHLVDDA